MENALSVGQLDRENLRKIRHLEAASADTGVLILLGNLERTAHSGWNEGTASEVDVSMRIRRVTDLQGRTVATNLPVEDNDLVQTTYFAGVEPDREDEDYDDHGVYGTVKRTWTRTVSCASVDLNLILLMSWDTTGSNSDAEDELHRLGSRDLRPGCEESERMARDPHYFVQKQSRKCPSSKRPTDHVPLCAVRRQRQPRGSPLCR